MSIQNNLSKKKFQNAFAWIAALFYLLPQNPCSAHALASIHFSPATTEQLACHHRCKKTSSPNCPKPDHSCCISRPLIPPEDALNILSNLNLSSDHLASAPSQSLRLMSSVEARHEDWLPEYFHDKIFLSIDSPRAPPSKSQPRPV